LGSPTASVLLGIDPDVSGTGIEGGGPERGVYSLCVGGGPAGGLYGGWKFDVEEGGPEGG
jgi:hypothetical protein